MGYDYWNSALYCVVDRMELEVDSKILLKALNTVEMKGKYLGDTGLTNSSLGEFVKVFAVAEGWRTGYFFCNGNNQTFVSYYLPAIVEENDDCVLNGALLSKQLKNISGDVTLSIFDVCGIQSDTKSLSMPIALVHPYEQALNTWLRLTKENCIYTEELGELELGRKITIRNGANLLISDLKDAITTCESIDSGIYTFGITPEGVAFMSSDNLGGHISTFYECNTQGEASISITSPLHKPFTGNNRINIYFNSDWGETEGQPLAIFSNNVCLVRAPYIQLEVE